MKTFLAFFAVFFFAKSIFCQNWNQILKTSSNSRDKLSSSARKANQSLGYSVDIDGDYAVVGGFDERAYVFKLIESEWVQKAILVVPDNVSVNRFGRTVAIHGNTIAIGATYEDEDEIGANTKNNSGAVYVFYKDQGGLDTWGQVKKIVANDRNSGDNFGFSIAISNETIAVGAHDEDEDASGANTLSSAGSAYIFNKNQGGIDNWGFIKKVVAPVRASSDYFGYSIAIDGNHLVVGAYGEDENSLEQNTLLNAGSAYVFNKDLGGTNNWGLVKKIVALDRESSNFFGFSVAISGSNIAVGAHRESQNSLGTSTLLSAGAAYIFNQHQGGADMWGQVTKIVPSDRAAGDEFGRSVDIDGNDIVIGAYGKNAYGGSAYVFNKDQNGFNAWGQLAILNRTDRAANDYFSFSISIKNGKVISGAYGDGKNEFGLTPLINTAGSFYIFNKDQGGVNFWGQKDKVVFKALIENQKFGQSVAIDGEYAVIGAMGDFSHNEGNNEMSNAGAAYIYKKNNGQWTLIKQLVAPDRQPDSYFGFSVSISGNHVVVGANKTGSSTTIGKAYVFGKDMGGVNNWGLVKKLEPIGRILNSVNNISLDNFGSSVSIDGSTIVVGAYEDYNENGTFTPNEGGSAFIFSKDQGGINNWGQVKKIVSSDRILSDQFGVSVTVKGTVIVVGANLEDEDPFGGNTKQSSGSAYIFKKDFGGENNWGQIKKVTALDRFEGDEFGVRVALNNDYLIVGAPTDDKDEAGGNIKTNSGSVYIYQKDQGGIDNWGQLKKIVAFDRNSNDNFGWSISMSGENICIGALGEDEDPFGANTLSNAGSVYIFNKNQGGVNNWGLSKKIVATDRAMSDGFGESVAIFNDDIIVGAAGDDENSLGVNTVSNSGSAYFFQNSACGSDLILNTVNYSSENIQIKSNGLITATNQITNTAKITYQSQAIILSPGFKAQPTSGGYFQAQIGGCN